MITSYPNVEVFIIFKYNYIFLVLTIAGCIFGYDFNMTYFDETITTAFGWVCEDSHNIGRLFNAAMLGNLFGCIIYGALADR